MELDAVVTRFVKIFGSMSKAINDMIDLYLTGSVWFGKIQAHYTDLVNQRGENIVMDVTDLQAAHLKQK